MNAHEIFFGNVMSIEMLTQLDDLFRHDSNHVRSVREEKKKKNEEIRHSGVLLVINKM